MSQPGKPFSSGLSTEMPILNLEMRVFERQEMIDVIASVQAKEGRLAEFPEII